MTEIYVALSPEDLLAGSEAVFDVVVPPELLRKKLTSESDQTLVVKLQPLTIGVFNLIMKAAKNDASLIPLLMIKESLVEPVLTLEQIKSMQLGLVNFLIAQIRAISGLAEKKT